MTITMARPLASYDTLYVAVAETLACSVLTVDAKLAATPGPRCPIDVITGT